MHTSPQLELETEDKNAKKFLPERVWPPCRIDHLSPVQQYSDNGVCYVCVRKDRENVSAHSTVEGC